MAQGAALAILLSVKGAQAAAGDIKHAQGAIEKLGGAATGPTRALGHLAEGIGNLAKTAAGVAIGIGLAQIPGMLFDAAKAAAADAASVAKLQQAVENSGASWQAYAGQLDTVINRGMRLGFADDQQRDALALLTAQTNDADEAQRRLVLAMDLSRGANIDLTTAAKLLGRVTDENVNVLSRYGVRVEKGATQTELFAAITAKFGGQAEQFGRSAAGSMAALELQMGELQEAIGGLLLPVLTELASFAVDTLVPAIQTHLVPALETAGQTLAQFVQVGRVLVTFFQQELSAAINELISGDLDKLQARLSNAFVVDSAVLRAGLSGIDKAWAEHGDSILTRAGVIWDGIHQVVTTIIAELVPFVQQELQVVIDWVDQNWPLIQRTIETIMKAIVALIDLALGAIVDFWRAHGASMMEIITSVWTIIKTIIDLTLRTILDIIKLAMQLLTGDWTGAWETIKGIFSRVWEAMKVIGKEATDALRAILDIAWAAIKLAVETVWNEIQDAIALAWEGIKLNVSDALGTGTGLQKILADAWSAITTGVTTAWNGIKAIIESVLLSIAKVVANTINVVIDSVNEMIRKLQSVINTLSGLVGGSTNISLPQIDRIPVPGSVASGAASGAVQNFNLTINSPIPTNVREDFALMRALAGA